MAKYNQDHLLNVSDKTADFGSIIAPIVRSRLGGVTNKRVLDIGCGTGKYSRLAASMGAKVTAIDRGPEQIKRAKQLAGPLESNIDFWVTDVCASDEIEARFDIVLLMFVVLDTASSLEFLNIVKSSVGAMKPGATLLLADVHPHNFKRPNEVEYVRPIGDGNYFSEGCPIVSEVLMMDGAMREFKPSYHYSLGMIINSFCNAGLSLKGLFEPHYKEEFPTHILLEFVRPAQCT